MTKGNRRLILPALMVSIIVLFAVPGINSEQLAFAETKPTILVADHLKNNPLALKIIAEMEAQKLRYKQQLQGIEQTESETQKLSFQQQVRVIQEPIIKITPQQTLVEEKRKIAQSNLEQDLREMQNEFEDYTPQNAFARFVSSLDSTLHAIYWDQFDYLSAKVKLANAAREAVLEDGGTYYEAQKEYFKYASMSRIEMINVIQDLNVRYGFADKNTQSYFDANGKLPRFENDDDVPCYGCKNGHSAPVLVNQADDPKKEIRSLQERLTELRQEFFDEDEIEVKKSLVNSMNDVVKKIQDLTYA